MYRQGLRDPDPEGRGPVRIFDRRKRRPLLPQPGGASLGPSPVRMSLEKRVPG